MAGHHLCLFRTATADRDNPRRANSESANQSSQRLKVCDCLNLYVEHPPAAFGGSGLLVRLLHQRR